MDCEGYTLSETFHSQFSWFSILWSCNKQMTIPNDKESQSHQIQQAQFLIFYKFSESDLSDIQVIGMMPYKMEKESFWLTPTQLCENELMGELFDEIFDANMIRLSDMQEKAIKFMRDEQ